LIISYIFYFCKKETKTIFSSNFKFVGEIVGEI